MPILNVRNIGSTGVNSDIEPWDLPPDALTDGINYRLSANKLQSVGGTRPVAPSIGDQIGHITQSTDYSGNSTWVLCGENNIKLYDGQSFTDIGTSLRAADPRFSNLDATKWSTCQVGQVVFLNHPQLYPSYWVNGAGDPAKPLWWHVGEESWEDENKSCRILCAHKNFLFALGMQEGAEEYRDKVWWSHPAEPDGIPFSWRPTWEQPDSIAGWVSLGRGGSIVGGESLRDSFVIYSEEAINIMDFTGDVLGSLKCDCGSQLKAALRAMGDQGAGVLLYLNQEGRGIGLANKMRAYALQDQGFDTVEANHRLGFEDDERDFRIGASLLRALGFSSARLMTNNPAKVERLRSCGINVVERVPLAVGRTSDNTDYLDVKAKKSGHIL